LRALADRAGMGEQAAAIAEQLLAARREQEASSGSLEQLEAQLLLEPPDLPRQRRLGDVEHLRRLRDGAVLGDGDEGFQAPEVHPSCLCPFGMKNQKNYALDAEAHFTAEQRAKIFLAPGVTPITFIYELQSGPTGRSLISRSVT
jgi:hypothetical protein